MPQCAPVTIKKVHEGIILIRRNEKVVHIIEWTSRLAKRIARSTSTAKLLATADAVDMLTYFKLQDEQNPGTRVETTEWILDSRSAFYLCSTLKEPEEVKDRLLLASIREEYHQSSMSTIRWTPGSTDLADVLTKGSQEIAKRLDEVLASGQHQHPNSSYVATSDVLGPTHDLN